MDLFPQIGQPGFAGVVNSSVVTWTPLFAVALLTQHPFTAFLVGIVSALGVAFTRTLFSLAEKNKGSRLSPYAGMATLLALVVDLLMTLPFLLPAIQFALVLSVVFMALKLLVLVALHSASPSVAD